MVGNFNTKPQKREYFLAHKLSPFLTNANFILLKLQVFCSF